MPANSPRSTSCAEGRMERRVCWGVLVLVLGGCGPSERPAPESSPLLCPSCAGGETGDFGGFSIIGEGCEPSYPPVTDEAIANFNVATTRPALEAPNTTEIRWELVRGGSLPMTWKTQLSLEIGVLDPEEYVHTDWIKEGSMPAEDCELPEFTDLLEQSATLQVDTVDGSVQTTLTGAVAYAEDDTWQMVGVGPLTGVLGNMDLRLTDGRVYEGWVGLRGRGSGEQRCGVLTVQVNQVLSDTSYLEYATATGSFGSADCSE